MIIKNFIYIIYEINIEKNVTISEQANQKINQT